MFRKFRVALIYLFAFLLPPLIVGGWFAYRSFASLGYVKTPAEFGGPLPEPPDVEDGRPVAAVLVSNAGTEITDLLAPHAILVESEAFQVVTIAPERTLCPVWPGLEIIPDYSFEHFAEQFPNGADVIVVPRILDHENSATLEWLKENAGDDTSVLSVCEGARTVAAAGLIDGKRAATHFFTIDELERQFPRTEWIRDVRYVSDGNVLSSAGVTAGIDASFALIGSVVNQDAAEQTAQRIGYELRKPQVTSPSISSGDMLLMLATGGFGWSNTTAGVVLYDGIDEFHLASTLDAYQRTLSRTMITITPKREPIRSKQGAWLMPNYSAADAPPVDRLLVIEPKKGDVTVEEILKLSDRGNTKIDFLASNSSGQAYETVLRDVARNTGVPMAQLVAKQVEFPPDRLPVKSPQDGRGWPLMLVMRAVLLGLFGVAATGFVRARVRKRKSTSKAAVE